MYILDCTLRDGGYYNSWDFPHNVAQEYIYSMSAACVDIIELGLRSVSKSGFKGPNAYSTEAYLATLQIPAELKVAVMVNASELLKGNSIEDVLDEMFPLKAEDSKVDVVRVACHVHEFSDALRSANWLSARGYVVGFNLMQIADRTSDEIESLSRSASEYPIDVLYFADSMGSMDPKRTTEIINSLRKYWKGAMGIHTHDNMGLALQNSLTAINEGVTWIDSTVTGMGRGPGNARTEELVIEKASMDKTALNIVPLMSIINSFFQPLKNKCGWGSNPYYYLSGKYGIHPTYIQEMLVDSRYSEEDILAAIDHLKVEGGKKFSFDALDSSRHFYSDKATGTWSSADLLEGKDVLILGAGPGVANHRVAIEDFIRSSKPIVIALNTQSGIEQELIDLRVASHPVRLLADCEAHVNLPQPLITPVSMLPEDVLVSLKGKELYDFGLQVKKDSFSFEDSAATVPNSLVISYCLAIAKSGNVNKILLAGFDGYGADDQRTKEMQHIFDLFSKSTEMFPLSITPTNYNIEASSVYAMQG